MSKKKKKKKIIWKRLFLVLLLIVVLVIGGGGFYYIQGTSAVSKESEEAVITVSEGDYVGKVLSKMKEQGLIKDLTAAKIYARIHHPVLKKNTYRLNKNMSLKTMMTIMEEANEKYIIHQKLTIPEGSTIPEVAAKVAGLLNVSSQSVINKWADLDYLMELSKKYWFLDYNVLSNKDLLYPLEGYLYPLTYYIYDENPTIESITTMMLDSMSKNLKTYESSYQKMGYNAHQFLTLCSIVQKETLFDKDIPLIAGVFINRLAYDRALQSDITVNYALQRTGVSVSRAMTRTQSKYNTYLYKGLPVGPVASVEEKVMKGVVNYTKSDYLYFFAKKDGSVIYSKTYEEHQAAVAENKWY